MMKEKKTWRYFWPICTIIIFVTNGVFLLFNINDWRIEVSESTILLSVIGFLFAFAAINIYSIFINNINDQKEKIDDLNNKGEALYEKSKEGFVMAISIVRFQTTILAISSTEKMNSQFLEWLDMAKNQVTNFVPLFNDFHDSDVSKEFFDSLHGELSIIVNNSIHLLDSQKTIINQDDFWKNHKLASTKQIALNEIDIIRKRMNDFLNYDFDNKRFYYEDPTEDNQSESYSGKKQSIFSELFNFIKRFRKKK